MNKIKYLAAVLIGIAGLGLQQAKADSVTYVLGSGNTAIAGFPGPYVQLVVTLNGPNSATLTYTSLSNGTNTYLMGDGGTVAANVNATSFSVVGGTGGVTLANSGTGFTTGPVTGFTSGTEDGFGNMNLQVNLFDGFTHSATSVSFTLTNLSGSWGSALDVLTNNNLGLLAGAHIFVTTNVGGVNASNGALATGFAANGGAGAPDGGTTVMLLGMALGVLGMARRFVMG